MNLRPLYNIDISSGEREWKEELNTVLEIVNVKGLALKFRLRISNLQPEPGEGLPFTANVGKGFHSTVTSNLNLKLSISKFTVNADASIIILM